jgi:holliday junction DNA helicase RuvB
VGSQETGEPAMNQSPASDIRDVVPTSLAHLIGQKHVVTQVAIAIEAAFADRKKFDHALLVGPPGVGKSALANVIAQEMACELHEVIGQAIKTPADLNELLLAAKDNDVLHIDECHEMKKPFQTALYLALDKRRIFLQGGGSKPQSISIADFTLLLSTTDEYTLLQPLRDRMKLLLRFEFYSVAELTEVLRQRIRALGWEVDTALLPHVAQRSRGTPRLALRLLQSCRRVCRADGESSITLAHLEKACQLEQIDGLGLGPTEQRYLRILAEGSNRLNVIASRLGLPARTVSQVTEPFLIRAELIIKDDQGRRQLTVLGREHVSNPCPGSV